MTDDENTIMRAAATATTTAAAAELRMTPTRLLQRLNQLIDREDVLAEYPQLVYRLRRITRR